MKVTIKNYREHGNDYMIRNVYRISEDDVDRRYNSITIFYHLDELACDYLTVYNNECTEIIIH